MQTQNAPLDRLKTFVASPMELIAVSDAIYFYLKAAQDGTISEREYKRVTPYLQSFQKRLIGQLQEEQRQ